MMHKEHAILLSVFLLFKFLSKDLSILSFIACFIHGIGALLATLPPCIKRFLTKGCNYKEAISWTPLIYISIDFVKSRALASIPGFFFCVWYAAKKYCLANNVLGISSRIQGIEMLSLGLLVTGIILIPLFPIADAACRSSLLTTADTVIPDIFVALALPIVVTGCRKKLMGKVWDWYMYGAKLKKFDGWVLHTAEGGERGEDDATALLEDGSNGREDGGSGSGPVNGSHGLENHDSGMALKNDESCQCEPPRKRFGQRAVQLLAIRANFPICGIYGYDYWQGRCIYEQRKEGVQEEGMVDVVPTGPSEILMAYGYFRLYVFEDFEDRSNPTIEEAWDVDEDEETEEYTQTICPDPGRKFEVTYLVIPSAIGAYVGVKLKLKDLGCRSCAVYGKIKASHTEYNNKSVHLFNYERGRSLTFPSGSTTSILLSPPTVAVPCRWELELHIEVDLTIITCDNQEEQDRNLKFSLEFTHEMLSQEREVDDDKVEVDIKWYQVY